VKILPDEVFRPVQLPDIETVAEVSLSLKNAVLENGTQFIYDEAKFKDFLDYVENKKLGTAEDLQIAREDLEKETPQALMKLFIKTELVATPAGLLAGAAEVYSGQGGVIEVYATASIIRAVVSYKFSRGVVENRVALAAGEMVPHAGRFTVFVMLAEEHPELTRLLWAYFKCRRSLKKEEIDETKVTQKFESAMQSNVLEFIIGPKEFTKETILTWQVKSKVIQTGISIGQAIGLR